MKYRLSLLLIAVQLVSPGSSFSGMHYNEHEKIISIDAKNMYLGKILSEISQQTGIKIYLNPSLDRYMSISIHNLPLEKALKRITRSSNHAFIYEGDKIVAIKIFQYSHADATTILPYEYQGSENNSAMREDNIMEIIEKEGYKTIREYEENHPKITPQVEQ